MIRRIRRIIIRKIMKMKIVRRHIVYIYIYTQVRRHSDDGDGGGGGDELRSAQVQ